MIAERDILRLLRRLGGGRQPLPGDAAVEPAVARGLAVPHGEAGLALTREGAAMLRRALAGGDDAFRAQHQQRQRLPGEEAIVVNAAESPLAVLRGRKGRDGRPLLDPAEFAAGERLRADFTRGQLSPRVTANWDAAVASGRRTGGSGGMAELTDAALAARLRVERALIAVGAEFAGVLLDFCCYLKGIEEIERERQWPARSAKLVLRLGLSALARHYGLSPSAEGRPAGGLQHWGADGYRPSIG